MNKLHINLINYKKAFHLESFLRQLTELHVKVISLPNVIHNHQYDTF